MALFSRRNRPNNDSDNKSIRVREKNSVNLQCPECGFEQREPGIAVSTYCRGCNTHYHILNGKAVPKIKQLTNAITNIEGIENRTRLRDDTPARGKNANNEPKPSFLSNAHHSSSNPVGPSLPKSSKRKSISSTLNNSIAKPRDVACFDCDRVHQAASQSSSTLCPACGSYISLKNYDIKGVWNRSIQTRGNVIIHKKATVHGITIQCHDLIAHGQLTGGVDCSGDVTIQSHGKIIGNIQCKRLIIAKRARVEFTEPILCKDAIIDGQVAGNFTCTGKLHLKRKATLSGDIKVAIMAVDEGARHHGQISIGS